MKKNDLRITDKEMVEEMFLVSKKSCWKDY